MNEIEFSSSIMTLLLHPDIEFQKQGLTLLEGLNDEEIWNTMMENLYFSPISPAKFQVVDRGIEMVLSNPPFAGLKQEKPVRMIDKKRGLCSAQVSNPFYDYSETTLCFKEIFPFDFRGLQNFISVNKLILSFQNSRDMRNVSPPISFEGLTKSQIKELRVEFIRGDDCSLSITWIEHLQNITRLELASQEKQSFEYQIMAFLPNLKELYLHNIKFSYSNHSLSKSQTKYHPLLYIKDDVSIFIEQDINRIGSSVFKDFPSEEIWNVKKKRKIQQLTWKEVEQTSDFLFATGTFSSGKTHSYTRSKFDENANHMNFSWFAACDFEFFSFLPTTRFEAHSVFSLLSTENIPLFEFNEHWIWAFEDLLPLVEILREPDKIHSKLLQIKTSIEQQEIFIIPICFPIYFWRSYNDSPTKLVLREIEYLNLKTLELCIEEANEHSKIEFYDINFPKQPIRKLIIHLQGEDPKRRLERISFLETFPNIEEVTFKNFTKIKEQCFSETLEKLPHLKKICFVSCKTEKHTINKFCSEYLPHVEYEVRLKLKSPLKEKES